MRHKQLATPITTVFCILALFAVSALATPEALETSDPYGPAPRPIPEVDDVYPRTDNWRDATILSISDSYESKRLFSRMVRALMPEGTRLFIEHRERVTMASWLETNRLRRMIRKHNPTVVAVSLDVGPDRFEQKRQLEKEISGIVTEIAPIDCYWFGTMSLLMSGDEPNEELASWVEPCVYVDPRVVDPDSIKRTRRGFSKSDAEKWAEKMWRRVSANRM